MYSTAFLEAWKETGLAEGGYSNHIADRGGETIWGITERVARANGYKGAMRDMPKETARDIAKTQYWDILNLDAVAAIAPSIAKEMFDTLYNGGEPGKWLQRALNVFNNQRNHYPDISTDGRIGPMTIAALKAFVTRRGPEGVRVLFNTLNILQGARFVDIAERNETQEAFAFGWLAMRAIFKEKGAQP